MSEAQRLVTGVSRAFWCDPQSSYAFVNAHFPNVSRGDAQAGTCWFDELFEGGIVLPKRAEGDRRGLSILISGAPGTCKSTLATEICYRAAIGVHKLTSVYVTTEAHKPWMIDNAKSYGWKEAHSVFDQNLVEVVPITDPKGFVEWAESDRHSGAGEGDWRDSLNKVFPSPFRKRPVPPDILVVDSLNSLSIPLRDAQMHVSSMVNRGPRIVILVLNAMEGDPASQAWEFGADVHVRLYQEYPKGYLVRTVKIEKARYQVHVWGRHQMKVYEPTSPRNDVARARAHPYREEGGIFVFPSIHYILSRYKTKSPTKGAPAIATPLPNLTKTLGNGLPQGRCTALVGGRGTHKSHLGYAQILYPFEAWLKSTSSETPRTSALVVSLRDDEGTTRETMAAILNPGDRLAGLQKLQRLQKQDLLEITYFPPGFITPEEFFHRLMLSVNRLKSSGRSLTVLFNSVDQLQSRFPLCVDNPIFLPGVIQMLSAEDATSIFVSAHEESISPDHYGLMSNAELIVSFKREPMLKAAYAKEIESVLDKRAKSRFKGLLIGLPESVSTVKLSVDRFAGGQPAGANGILELVTAGSPLRGIVTTNFGDLIFVPVDRRMIA